MTDAYLMAAGLTGYTPKLLQPVFGRLFSIPNRLLERRIQRRLKPTYEERVAHLLNPSHDPHYTPPSDHLQRMLEYAHAKSPSELNLTNIAGRLEMANLGTIHQTAVAITNTIFDVLSSDLAFDTIRTIQDDMSNALFAHDGNWTKAAVAQMVQTDSVLRESLRLSSFGNRSMIRHVCAADGLTTEDGVHLPRGTMVSIVAYPAQTDPDAFDDARNFDPYRFARLRDRARASATDPALDPGQTTRGSTASDPAQEKPRSLDPSTFSFVSTGPTHLTFGHGRHACPGRFIVDFELKMMLRFLFTHYDVELLPEQKGARPSNRWIAEANFPPTTAKIRVRRKKGM